MIEVDHSTLPQPEPEPAVPILASHLLQLEEKQRTRFTKDGRPERLSTHCEDIDEILGGGVERGIVMGISAEGTEGQLISLHLLASVLLNHLSPTSTAPPSIKATIIDTTGSFPLPLLAQVLKSRITTTHSLTTRNAIQTANHPVSRPDRPQVDAASIEQEVQQCLEMIAISRVFNIEGLWEVLGEIGHESPPSPSPTSLPPLPDNKTDGPIQSSPDWPEIVDSQAPSPLSDPDPPSPTLQKEDADLDIGPEILLISTLTQIINNLFARKETPSTDAHTLLSFLSRHLVTLSRTRNILTILHNSTTPSSSHSSSSKPSSTFPNNQSAPEKKKKSNPQPTSVFASNPLKPALGILFGQFPELHLFVSPMPRGRSDAEVLYSGEREGGEVRFVSVVEVLRDECPGLGPDEERGKDEKGKGKGFGYREQRWCAVEVCDEGAGAGAELKGAFGMRGGMRGMGMERRGIGRGIGIERGSTETEVGNVAKVWGFGGRRV